MKSEIILRLHPILPHGLEDEIIYRIHDNVDLSQLKNSCKGTYTVTRSKIGDLRVITSIKLKPQVKRKIHDYYELTEEQKSMR